jgi:hypothetical protein
MAAVEKLDLYKEHKEEYVQPREPVLVNVRPAKYLAIEGHGKPGDELFQAQVGTLFGMAYTIKMGSKAAGRDYKVCGLEGLYSAAADGYDWQLLIRVPEFVTARDLRAAAAQLAAKGRGEGAGDVKLVSIREDKCVQVLHIGAYKEETGTIRRMEAFAAQQGLSLRGPHHEIYVSDPRRVPAARLKTILRSPVA